MHFIMKIIVGCLLSVIVIFNGRLTNIVFATESGQPIKAIDKNGRDVTNTKESIPVLSDSIGISTNFFHETENQELLLPSQSIVAEPPILDNIDVSSELSTTAEAVVFPSTDTAVELKNRVKSQFQNDITNNSNQVFNSFENEKEEYVVHAEPKVQVQPITEEPVMKEMNESESVSELETKSSQEELKKTAPQHEDIPSFSEWTQIQLAEAEKKKTGQNDTANKSPKRGKFRNKNYASPDCGAKIVAANPESRSSSAVLSSLKDEYMLNYCTNRIWFVVELCEAIQAKQLDLANFELFSSSPKHFSVSVSHRFPTREWSNVGKFTAQDSRDVQTFNLQPHLFGKYVKVELHSHYGREQFCPISWVGVYGTSEFEVLAKEDERHLLPEDDEGDQYDEDIYVGHRRDSPKNLFSSATDAVLSIVKKATAPFMGTDNNETKSENPGNLTDSKNTDCVSPRYITVCNNCSQSFYDEVFNVLSCQHIILSKLISNSFVKRILISTETCTKFGLDFSSLRMGAPFPFNFLRKPGEEVNYLTVMLKDPIIAALCNVLAVFENRVVVNATVESDQTLKNVTGMKGHCGEVNPSKPEPSSLPSSSSVCKDDCPQYSHSSSPLQYTKSSVFTDIFKPSEQFSQKIEPTKTLTEDEVEMLPPSIYLETPSKVQEEISTDLPKSGHVTSTATATLGKTRSEVENSMKTEAKVTFVEPKVEVEKEVVDDKNNVTNQYSTLESIMNEINVTEKVSNSPSNSNFPTTSNLPAESIFLRLANRIKTLEINMSLSSTYLEELSKRYKTQLELLSKTLNLTIQKIEEHSKMEEEKERKKEKEILMLRMQLANLTRDVSVLVREKNSWRPRASSISQHIFFISIEILLIWVVFNYWKRHTDNKNFSDRLEPPKKLKLAKRFRRRNSLEGVRGHETPRRKARRPSDEALEIALSRSHGVEPLKIDKKRKRRKKDSKCSINVIHMKRKRSDTAAPEVAIEKPTSSVTAEETPKLLVIPNNVLSTTEVEVSNRFAPISSPPTPSENSSNAVSKAFQGFSSSPIFIKTALATRNSRLRLASDKESSQDLSVSVQELTKKETRKKGSNSFKKYMKKFF